MRSSVWLAAFVLVGSISPTLAQVPVNDAQRTSTETQTARCMERAKSYKQSTVKPTDGIKGSVATPGGAGAIPDIGNGGILGTALSAGSIGGMDLAKLLAAGGMLASLKSEKAGKVTNALALVTAALQTNQLALTNQGGQIGQVTTIQGGFDQNSAARLAGASVWGQAVQAGTTTLDLRNQQLMDQIARAASAAKVMGYDKTKARLVADGVTLSDNAVATTTDGTTIADIQAQLLAAQTAARAAIAPEAGQ